MHAPHSFRFQVAFLTFPVAHISSTTAIFYYLRQLRRTVLALVRTFRKLHAAGNLSDTDVPEGSAFGQ